jgi:beta-N-acetylhexosaminidase
MSGPLASQRAPAHRHGEGLSESAQLLWIGLPGPEIDDETSMLLEAGVGGVVLFSHNISGASQVRRLAGELRSRATRPLRVAIDHEGGHIVRIGAPLTRFPSAMAIGATGSEELAAAVGRAMGRELAAIGFDVNLAPVLDVAADPRNPSVGTRSFGSSPALVARLGSAFIRGLRAAGVAATAKHFPGHGRTPIDSHVDLPVLEGGIDALQLTDLPPFRAAIEADVDLVMASHLVVDGLTDGLPASLSSRAMIDLLRRDLGFDGLVVTDALRMGALADHDLPAACVRAVAAGADVVMPLDDQPAALAALTRTADDVHLTARIEEALGRVFRLDQRLRGSMETRNQDLALPDPDHADLAGEVARRSLTLVSDGTCLPIPADASVAVIEFPSRRSSPVEELAPGDSVQRPPSLADALRPHVPRTRDVQIDVDGPGDASSEGSARGREAALDAARSAELVVCATRDAYLWPSDRDLVADVVALGHPVILVALRNPYDLAILPATAERIAAYADVPATFEALADALTGRAGWPGLLPIDLDAALAEDRV